MHSNEIGCQQNNALKLLIRYQIYYFLCHSQGENLKILYYLKI